MQGEGLRGRVVYFNLALLIKSMKIWAVWKVFALYLFEEKSAVLHGSEEAPEDAAVNLKFVAGLSKISSTRTAIAASN